MGVVIATARNLGWGLYLLKLPAGIVSPMDMDQAARLETLGSVEEVVARISEIEPGSESGWIWSSTWSIEVQFADDNPDGLVEWVILGLRGRGDDVIERVLRLADALGCAVYDGDFRLLSGAEDVASWHAYQRMYERDIRGDVFDAVGQPLGQV